MGYLILDHRGGQNYDGSKGTLQEYDTVLCVHCQAIIAIGAGPVKKYQSKYRCFRCGNKPICKHCGEVNQGKCTPINMIIDEAIKHQRAMEWHEYHYQCSTRR